MDNGKKLQVQDLYINQGISSVRRRFIGFLSFSSSIIFPTLLVKNEWKNTSYNYSFSLKLGLA
jgi:hypothetical protein